ncbi:MAG: hypothetical protein CMI35_01115 [Owenweeksia sp.]|nr:hypothetical protein [Owenweeksia sp.]
MTISGFTFVRNAPKLFIPVKESVASILPLVDEFVIALGKGDPDDTTEQEIRSLNSPKIRILHTEWESDRFPRNTIFAQQTDLAKEACKGDWLFYLQGDEALHEKYHPVVKKAFKDYLHDTEVEGLLFSYRHFWGDFDHYNPSHAFYSREIRVIRNLPEIHSWKDAQSFRYHTQPFHYSFEDYQKKEGTRKLNVAQVKAEIYHYGWVRPPELMGRKRKISSSTYRGKEATEALFAKQETLFDYGPLNKVAPFKGSHPATMQEWIKKINWKDQLQYSGKRNRKKQPSKHEKWKYRWLSWVENHLLGGKRIGEFKNFTRIR